MKVKSIRIPEDIDKALEYIAQSEKLEKTQSLRKLTRIGFEYYIARSYREGRLTLREAADLLHLTPLEIIDLFLEMGVGGNIKAKEVMESLNQMR